MRTVKRGTSKKGDTALLQDLLRKAGYDIVADGAFGAGTEAAVRDFQKKNALVVNGVVGSKTWMKFAALFPDYFRELAGRFLSEDDMIAVAKDLGVVLATIKAVTEVEAQGIGFWGDRPKILFERHIFWKQLKKRGLDPKKFAAGNSDILSTRSGGYKGGTAEYARLDRAKAINQPAALESASWGMFQIMGFHWQSLGYTSPKKFVGLMYKGEAEHLKAFGKFVTVNKLVRYLKAEDWAGFARRYNGPAYKRNKYDQKLARAFRKHSRDA